MFHKITVYMVRNYVIILIFVSLKRLQMIIIVLVIKIALVRAHVAEHRVRHG